MNNFIDGVVMTAFCISGLFFLRFWRKSRDRFFLLFALSFWIMGINRLFMVLIVSDRTVPNENHAGLYVIRLIAFAIVILAIIDKNRGSRSSVPPADGPP